MNKRIKKLWLYALRKGEFKQGVGHLRKGAKHPKHCCLGVLCELHRRETHEGTWKKIKGAWWYGNGKARPAYESGLTRASGVLPECVRKWAGLPDNNPKVHINAGPLRLSGDQQLSYYNDAGFEFDQIANAIEGKL